MRAGNIMISDIVTCGPDETLAEALEKLYALGVRMLPVVDDQKRVLGVLGAFALLKRVVPEYIASGDLDAVHYTPDLGLMQRRFHDLLPIRVSEVMDRKPGVIKADESLLAVTTELISDTRYGYLLVIDGERHLQGIISCNDILRAMRRYEQDGSSDA